MIFTTRPNDFNTEINVVACYLQHDGRFVLLQRQPHKTHGGKWGLPAGKVEEGENQELAIVREIFEETGIKVSQEDLKKYQSLWVRNEGHDIDYHTFSISLGSLPPIVLSIDEHQDFKWVTPRVFWNEFSA